MSTPEFEAFLARIYVDSAARARFIRDPRGESLRAGLTQEQAAALEAIDCEALELTASSFRAKRDRK